MNGLFSGGLPIRAGRETPRRQGARARLAGLLGLLFLVAVHMVPAGVGSADNAASPGGSYQKRAAVEKKSRSRYRRLEVASFVLILACGGAAVLWAIRRK